ncbi:FRG domain-containing protein [Raoultella terrigena]|uniref:FRG domain-containing protein n=1 Tax=Raoultella terrigena TaxID=577 RepID=UPI000F4BB412|nr:FRG domain-containing protein [Raoultella terrigena]ROR99699.1 FRG domain-containing protein [Raoultella terrigena]
MRTIETDVFGRVVEVDCLSQILSILVGKGSPIYLWRGQGQIEWPIHSAAYRRLLKSKFFARDPDEEAMRDYERDLLTNARHQGYGFENGRNLTDFELLAKLQHHGAATRFIDVSRNMLVALWFACRSHTESTGLLFGVNTGMISGIEGNSENSAYNDAFPPGKIIGDEDFPRLWQPPVVTKRIAAQSAQFLYSTVSHNRMGSLVLDIRENATLAMAITPKVKKKFLRLLEDTFDIRLLTLFPDIDGFCSANSEHFSRYNNDRW